jgi:hypothetical protein
MRLTVGDFYTFEKYVKNLKIFYDENLKTFSQSEKMRIAHEINRIEAALNI